MAAKEMADYLSNATADYTAMELSLVPQHLITEIGGIGHQKIFDADDDNDIVISYEDTPEFFIAMGYRGLSEDDAGLLFDFFFNPDKANGWAKSFYWQHPTDGHIYTARFDSDMKRVVGPTWVHSITMVRLKVLGNKP